MVEIGDLIAKLIIRTDEGRVPWKPAVGESSFSATFGDLAVLISSSGYGLKSTCKLSVLNEKGTEIATVQDDGINADGPEYPQLHPLFDSAKRMALNTDRKLVELMELLDNAPPVTPEEPTQNQPRRRP